MKANLLVFRTSLIPLLPHCPPNACWDNLPSILLWTCIANHWFQLSTPLMLAGFTQFIFLRQINDLHN
uniref:Putative ovule protein n=1 Tax=Solanum chacoense TaxID=4108 RepID=A0A0V0H0V4_SOLCH